MAAGVKAGSYGCVAFKRGTRILRYVVPDLRLDRKPPHPLRRVFISVENSRIDF